MPYISRLFIAKSNCPQKSYLSNVLCYFLSWENCNFGKVLKILYMNIEELRDYCLSLPDTTEKMPFEGFFHNHESLLTFNVDNHIFCMADIHSSPVECTIKVAADKIEQLHEEYTAVGKPYNFTPKHWISLKAGGDMPDKMIYNLIEESYNLVKGE